MPIVKIKPQLTSKIKKGNENIEISVLENLICQFLSVQNMCVEEGCHMAAKYNTTFSWEQSKKYRSSQSGICVFNKTVPQILRILWVQTKVMGVEPKGNPINFKCFLWRGDVGWQSGEMLCVLQIPDPLLAISLIAGCLLVAVQVTSVVNAPYPPGARAGVRAFLFLHCYIPPPRCWGAWSLAVAVGTRQMWLWWQDLRIGVLFFFFLSLCYFYSAFMFLLQCCQSTVSKNINVIKTW